MTKPIPLIHDGDHGSDDFITTLMFALQPETFNLLGVTGGFGNVPVDVIGQNICAALHMAGRSDIPVYLGADVPLVGKTPLGDNAFSDNGLGGATPEPAPFGPRLDKHAVDWIIETLRQHPEPVTIAATGPLTNIAHVLRQAPDVKSKIKEMAIMGGCLGPLGPNKRRGNVTEHAEFNFYMDPHAANVVLQSGVPITLHMMDTNHALVFTPERQSFMKDYPVHGPVLATLMNASAHLDEPKFGTSGAFIHDAHVAIGLMDPEIFDYQEVGLSVDVGPERRGALQIENRKPTVRTAQAVRRMPDYLFGMIAGTLQSIPSIQHTHQQTVAYVHRSHTI